MKRTKNPAKEAEYRKRAADLVAQMTLHEKVSQMLISLIAYHGTKQLNL